MPDDFNDERIGTDILPADPRPPHPEEIEGLWSLFALINSTWRLFHTRDPETVVPDAKNLRSSWLEFVNLRFDPPNHPAPIGPLPPYGAEYTNAIRVREELRDDGGDAAIVDNLLLCEPPREGTRLWHAKKFVADEFMTVMIVAGGFKEFGGRNYKGFLGGSRFNQVTDIRSPIPAAEDILE